jgi:heptosyltransferase-2
MDKVLIIQTAFIGDAILTLPMIQKLKDIFNDVELHVLCIPTSAEIFSASPFVIKVLIYDKK